MRGSDPDRANGAEVDLRFRANGESKESSLHERERAKGRERETLPCTMER